jgi:acylglycerol lipase
VATSAQTDPASASSGSGAAGVSSLEHKALTTWPGHDGTALHVRHWPAAVEPWATVVLVHGIGEHGGRYQRTGMLMAEAGLDVHAFDLRGHGLSGGRRVFVQRWSEYIGDLEVALAKARTPGRPLVVVGHSMGALIALGHACSDGSKPDLLVLSAPPLGANAPGWQKVVAPILSRIAPTMVIANPIVGDQLSRDPAVGSAYFADPLVQPRSTARLGAELFAAMKSTKRRIDRLSTPTLVVHGGSDKLVPTAVSEPLADVPAVERRVLVGLRHESLNEPEGPEVVAAIVEWLRARVPATGGAA